MSNNKEFTPEYSRYVLFVLFIVYVFNFADRFILIVVQTDIQKELGLEDWQMGMLHGLVFAAFYTIVGIPIARLADRRSRTGIISIGLVLWSGLTAVCGLAQNFTHLLLARIGVGVGEATATPCSHSLISDYFPPESRSKAIAIYTIGANFGMLIGMMAGGYIAKNYGWRNAFYIVGLPGLLIALLLKLTVREPPRGMADGVHGKVQNLPLKDTIGYLFSLKSFRHLCIAGAIAALTGFGIMNWSPVFFERIHGMTTDETGPLLGVAIGIVGGFSTFLGGFLADRLSRKSRQWPLRVAAIGMIGMLPFVVLFLMIPNKTIAIVGINLTFLVGLLYNAPTFATVQGLARPDMRALATAIFLFVINLVGMGLGPLLVGAMSSWMEPTYGESQSLRYAMLIISVGTIWASVHYMIASRSLPGDLDRAKL